MNKIQKDVKTSIPHYPEDKRKFLRFQKKTTQSHIIKAKTQNDIHDKI